MMVTGDEEACVIAQNQSNPVEGLIRSWGPAAVRDLAGLLTEADLKAALARWNNKTLEDVLNRHEEGGKHPILPERGKVICSCHGKRDSR